MNASLVPGLSFGEFGLIKSSGVRAQLGFAAHGVLKPTILLWRSEYHHLNSLPPKHSTQVTNTLLSHVNQYFHTEQMFPFLQCIGFVAEIHLKESSSQFCNITWETDTSASIFCTHVLLKKWYKALTERNILKFQTVAFDFYCHLTFWPYLLLFLSNFLSKFA